MRPAVKRQENVVCLALGSPAEDEATMLALLGRWMRFEQRDFYRVRVDNSEIVCFYDTLTAQGVYWEETGTSAHDFGGRPTSTAPWDEHLDRLFGRDRRKQGDHGAPAITARLVAFVSWIEDPWACRPKEMDQATQLRDPTNRSSKGSGH
jgi:hypothetical protein